MAASNGNGTADDVLNKSVTRDDYNQSPWSGVYHLNFPALSSANTDLAPFWSYGRDYALASTLYREAMWSAALGLAISKIVARGYEVKSDIPLRAKRAQDLFINFDSRRGYVSGLQKHLLNFLLTGNGAHVEVVRASPALGSRILGLVPLDTFRCRRTGDPTYPLIYRDRVGREHVMRDFEVFSMSDMPDPADTWFDVGHCAAERAYAEIIKLEAINRYILEKVSGQRVLAIHVIGGVTTQNIEDAKKGAQADAQARGVVTYLGAAMIASMGDTPVSVVTIPLAELPDGFNRKEEWDISLNTYARCIGIPVQDLQPLSGQGLGTGAQTQILDEAAKGQGLAAWGQDWEYHVNEWSLDERTTYAIHTNDMRDREREAKVRIDESAAIMNWFNMGLTPEQAINLGVDRGQLPEEYRPKDLTPGAELDEDQKPDQEAAEAADAPAEPADTERPDTPAKPATGAPGAPATIKAIAAEPAQPNARELATWLVDLGHVVGQALDRQTDLEQARQESADTGTMALLKELAEFARHPQTAPVPDIVVNVPPQPAPVVNVPAPIVRVQAADVHVPAPVVIADPATPKAIAALAEQLSTRAKEANQPRRMRVLKRDAQGRVAEWEEE